MIALFGGSFDPVHLGHLRIAEDIREYYQFEKVVFIPTYLSPLKSKHYSAPEDRLNMINIAIKDCPYFEVIDYEINKKGKSYTIDTVKHFKNLLGYNPFFIVGSDAFLTLHNWKEPEELLKLTNFIVVNRDINDFENVKNYLKERFNYNNIVLENIFFSKPAVYLYKSRILEISSTEIRERVKNNLSIKFLVLPEVQEYIHKRNLYK